MEMHLRTLRAKLIVPRESRIRGIPSELANNFRWRKMAQRVEVVLIDDIDGGKASETVTFALDGVTYEIDLSNKNASKLRDDFATWTGHARRSGAAKSARGRRGAAPKR